MKKSGHARDISESTIEDIIFSSSLSLRRFTVNEISYITERACNYVANGLDLVKDNAFVDKDSECCYAFNCSEVKNILYTQSIQKRKERVLSYYKYYTENEPDEYYYRAYYLIMYFQEITSQSFALLALSLIYSFKLEDSVQISKIYTLLSSYDTSDYTMKLNDILRTFPRTILPEYLLYLVKSDMFIFGGKQTFSGAVGQQRVGKEYVYNYLCPIPPQNEQKRIIEKCSTVFKMLNSIEKQIT